LCTRVHSSQKVEMTQRSIDRWMNKQLNTNWPSKEMKFWHIVQYGHTLKTLC
jgi:hypothetical protein